MSGYHEGCQLTFDEIAAVAALAGKKTLVGFRPEEMQELTAERVWSACAGLMRDAMMTQIDGKFRLCKALVDVMQPVCEAKTILAMTPSRDQYTQQLYYGADRVAAVERSPFGRYILSALEKSELTEALEEHLELEYPREVPSQEEGELIPMPETDAPREKLLEGARFLVEQLDPETGARTEWLRVVELGLFSWVQWTANGAVCHESLTRDTLDGLLRQMLK